MLAALMKSVSSGRAQNQSVDSPKPVEPIQTIDIANRIAGNESIEQPLGPCPSCQGGSFWEPRFQDGVWKCVECEPAPNPVLVGRTRQIEGCRPQISIFEPVVVCMGSPVCDSCLSTHLEVLPTGYRCGTCCSPIKKSSDEIFFDPQNKKSVEQKINRKYFGSKQ